MQRLGEALKRIKDHRSALGKRIVQRSGQPAPCLLPNPCDIFFITPSTYTVSRSAGADLLAALA